MYYVRSFVPLHQHMEQSNYQFISALLPLSKFTVLKILKVVVVYGHFNALANLIIPKSKPHIEHILPRKSWDSKQASHLM